MQENRPPVVSKLWIDEQCQRRRLVDTGCPVVAPPLVASGLVTDVPVGNWQLLNTLPQSARLQYLDVTACLAAPGRISLRIADSDVLPVDC